MKVLVARAQDGNTVDLVEQILKGVDTEENTIEQLFLYDYTISLCTDCRTCKKGIISAL